MRREKPEGTTISVHTHSPLAAIQVAVTPPSVTTTRSLKRCAVRALANITRPPPRDQLTAPPPAPPARRCCCQRNARPV